MSPLVLASVVLLFTSMWQSAMGAPELQCGGFASFCVAKLQKIDPDRFTSLLRVKSYKDVKVMNDTMYINYIRDVRDACTPYMEAVNCYADRAKDNVVRKNDNAFWKCHDSESFYNVVLESAGDKKSKLVDNGITSAKELEHGFAAMNKLCSESFISGMETHGVCLRHGISKNTTLAEKTDHIEKILTSNCFRMNCVAARLYANFYVSNAHEMCGAASAAWVFRFAKTSLNFHHRELNGCVDLKSGDWNDYNVKVYGDPGNTLNYKETADCTTTTTTTTTTTDSPKMKSKTGPIEPSAGGVVNWIACPPGYHFEYSSPVNSVTNGGEAYEYDYVRNKRSLQYGYYDYDGTSTDVAEEPDQLPPGCMANSASTHSHLIRACGLLFASKYFF